MKHSTDTELERYFAHMLDGEEEMALLGHVAECEYCAGRFAHAFPKRELLTPPPGLRHGVLRKAAPVSRTFRKWEFYRYSARVVIAVGMALFLLVYRDSILFSGSHMPGDVVVEQEKPGKEERTQERNIISSALKESSTEAGRALGEWSEQVTDKLFGNGTD